jgi:gluconate kinase
MPTDAERIAELEATNARMRAAAANGCGVCHCAALAEAQEQNTRQEEELLGVKALLASANSMVREMRAEVEAAREQLAENTPLRDRVAALETLLSEREQVLIAVADAFEGMVCDCGMDYGEPPNDEDCATHHHAVRQAVKVARTATSVAASRSRSSALSLRMQGERWRRRG